jgi:ferredoxin/flavodoxin---NADP+ reductase
LTDTPVAKPVRRLDAFFYTEPVTWVHHWTDSLFSFRTARSPELRFASGQFVMVGLQLPDGKPLVRAYSIASATDDEQELEFYSIKVQDGPLTSRLQHIKVGDQVLVGKKPTGTLVLEGLRPGKRLYLVGTGTGLAPWLSLVRDPEVYARFDEVIVTHTVREVRDLSYRDFFETGIQRDPKVGALAAAKLRYYPSVTREAFRYEGRITDLIASGKLFQDLGAPPLDPKVDRLMLCGSPGLLADLKTMLTERGYDEGAVATPGDYVLEKAFVT